VQGLHKEDFQIPDSMEGDLSALGSHLVRNCENLHKHIKERKAKNDKANHKEKVNGDFLPYTMDEHYGMIKDEIWDLLDCAGWPSIC
jgi:hypothetical protein